jgi:UDPglucose--hexose-1-phosphate uridylyltransferase
MPELRKDPITGRWVVVTVEDPFLPQDFNPELLIWKGPEGCPFCYGNENFTPIEIEAVSDIVRQPNTPGWKVRVIPNKFAALRIEGELNKRAMGMYDLSHGIGAHEVIVETPEHTKQLEDLPDADVEAVLKVYRSRSLDLRKDKRFKYLMIFKNFGAAAGATQEHSHSQLVALPMVPKSVKEEVKGAQAFYEYRERCIFCDMLAYEEENAKERVVAENEHFVAFCPLSSRFSFEIWIVPRDHCGDFGDMAPQQTIFLAKILKDMLNRLKKVLGQRSYNYLIHSSPVNSDPSPAYHWHLEIMPKLSRVAGFEWGSGFYVVNTPPELAAKCLRESAI